MDKQNQYCHYDDNKIFYFNLRFNYSTNNIDLIPVNSSSSVELHIKIRHRYSKLTS